MRNPTPESRIAIGFIHGLWQPPSGWDKVRPILEAAGHPTVAVDLPSAHPGLSLTSDKPKETFRQDTRAAIEQLKDYPDLLLVGHSWGANIALHVAVQRAVRGTVLVCPGLHNATTHPLLGNAAARALPPRLSEEFIDGINYLNGDMTEFKKSRAGRVLYNRCSPAVRGPAIKSLRPQRRSQEEPSLTTLPKTSVSVVMARYDNAINNDWTECVSEKLFGIKPDEIESDHSPHLSLQLGLGGLILSKI